MFLESVFGEGLECVESVSEDCALEGGGSRVFEKICLRVCSRRYERGCSRVRSRIE